MERTTGLTIDNEGSVTMIERLGRAGNHRTPYGPGTLEVGKLLHRRPRSASKDHVTELVYAAKPGSKTSHIRWVHFLFQDGPAELPAPELEIEEGRIRMFYPLDQFDRIKDLMRTHRDRFCYFWQAADSARVRAWIFTPQ